MIEIISSLSPAVKFVILVLLSCLSIILMFLDITEPESSIAKIPLLPLVLLAIFLIDWKYGIGTLIVLFFLFLGTREN